MIKLLKILQEIEIDTSPHFIKGKYYDIWDGFDEHPRWKENWRFKEKDLEDEYLFTKELYEYAITKYHIKSGKVKIRAHTSINEIEIHPDVKKLQIGKEYDIFTDDRVWSYNWEYEGRGFFDEWSDKEGRIKREPGYKFREPGGLGLYWNDKDMEDLIKHKHIRFSRD